MAGVLQGSVVTCTRCDGISKADCLKTSVLLNLTMIRNWSESQSAITEGPWDVLSVEILSSAVQLYEKSHLRRLAVTEGHSRSQLLLFLCTRHYMASYHSTWLKIVNSWPTSAADHCDRLMSWRVPQEEHKRVSETGVYLSLDRVSGTLCLLHYETETSHLYSLRHFWRHFCLSSAAAHSDCCFFALRTNILTYLLFDRSYVTSY